MEFAFYKKLVLQHVLEKLSDVEHVFLGRAGEDKDVIDVDEDEPVQHVTENIINQSLEISRGVDKVKGHDQELVVATGHVEGRLPLIPLPYPHRW
jgi:hypothetical protein